MDCDARHGGQKGIPNSNTQVSDLKDHTDIPWIDRLIREGVDPVLRKKYVREDANPWLVGLLLDPEGKLTPKGESPDAGAGLGARCDCSEVIERSDIPSDSSKLRMRLAM